MINNNGPMTDPWGTPDSAEPCLDECKLLLKFEPLHPFTQFFNQDIHIYRYTVCGGCSENTP